MIDWTPWIILLVIIFLTSVSLGVYFYWLDRDEKEKIEKKKPTRVIRQVSCTRCSRMFTLASAVGILCPACRKEILEKLDKTSSTWSRR
jgi:DNA-directed RNA polymerase subunit RPC12/RpoP